MGITLPFKRESAAIRPAATRRYPNGKIPATVLQPCGIRSFVMVDPAARAMRAMVQAAAADGITLSATGTWRSFDQQVALFKRRYTTTNTGRRHEVWQGRDYWLKPGVAGAAVPGTSNHGRGTAADLSEGVDGTIPLTAGTLRWLADHGPAFGYWNTVRSEAWHWCYCLGDDVPQPVRDVEQRDGLEAPSPIAWDAIGAMDDELSSIPFPGELVRGAESDAVTAVQWKLVAAGLDIGVDGEFGERTERAVRTFQERNGLGVDGRVGPDTWAALGLAGGAAAEPPDAVTYVVQPGDGFLRIASRTLFETSFAAANEIADANGLAIDAPLQPGQRLAIPNCLAATVAAGDGWISVAARLGRPADDVQAANDWQGALLHPGMVVYGGRRPPS